MAAAKLNRDFLANRSTITAAFKDQAEFRSKPFHANDVINENQLRQIELQAQNVEAIWKMLFERQSKGVLTWPEALGQKFRDYVAKRKFGDDIPRDLRDTYRDYIDRHFESLPKKIGARVLAEGETGGMGGMGGESFMRGGGRGTYRGEGGGGYRGGEGALTPGVMAGPEDDYLCEWLDQGLVRQELDFPTTPSAIKIWVTQENLWVYHTLLDIISNTNEAAHADRISNAAVRTIYSLEVGRPAALASLARGRVEIMQAPTSAAGLGTEGGEMLLEGDGRGMPTDGGGEYMSPDFMGERGRYGEGGGAGMSPLDEQAMLLAARYVDATGKPEGAGMAAATTEGVDPSLAAPAAELPTGPFKRLPIRMTLKMDQRWLTQLISECASQPLPVEVTEVRINPLDGGGMGGGEGSYRGGLDGSGGGGGSSYQPPINSTSDVLTFQQNPHVVTVVIQGIVTIFNEPDPSVLKVDAGEQMAATQ
jgi:hypothetical protein